MKFLKTFQTEAEYEAYKNSEEFVEPNVAFVTSTKKTYFSHKYTLFKVADGDFETSDDTLKVLRYKK